MVTDHESQVGELSRQRDSEQPAIDLFISYTSRDLQWAQWLVEFLEGLGYVCRYQHRDFAIGRSFLATMQKYLVESTHVLAILSPAYEESDYCSEEWTSAYHAGKLIPIRVADYEPAGMLSDIAHIDIVGFPDDDAESKLQTELQRIEPSGSEVAKRRLGRPRYAYPGRLHPVPAAGAPLLGRDDRLSELDELLDQRNAPVPIVPDADGAAGAGCTALAADYVRSRADKYDTVCWVPSSDPQIIDLEYWRLGRELGLPPADRTMDGVKAELGDRARNERVLIVFDGAPPRGQITDWLPEPVVSCLITSRSGSYRGQIHAVTLGPLTPDQAMQALSNEGRADATVAVNRLAELLDYRPRAVRLAAAYLRAVDTSVESLLDTIESRRSDGRSAEDAVKELALDQVVANAGSALQWLAVLGFGASRPIPLHALSAPGGTRHPALADALHKQNRDRALDALTRLELAYEVGDSVAISGWVGPAAMRRLAPSEQEVAAAAAIETFTAAFVKNLDRGDELVSDQLAPHVWNAIHAASDRVAPTTILEARAALGRYMSSIRAHELAKQVINEGLATAEQGNAPAEELLVRAHRELARVHRLAGEAPEAAEHLEIARADADGDDLIEILIELGDLHAVALGSPDDASAAFGEAGRLIGDADAHTELRLSLLAARSAAHECHGDLDAAHGHADDRVDLASRWAGDDAVQTTDARVDRGRLRRRLGRGIEAETDLLAAISHMDDERDERLAEALVEYAGLLVEVGRPGEAFHPLGRAAVIHSRRIGPRCDEINDVLAQIADLYDETGDTDRAVAQRARSGRADIGEPPSLPKQLLDLDDTLQEERCTLIVGPDVTNRLFASRDEMAQRWAKAEGYPLEAYRMTDLPSIAEYMSIVHAQDVRARLKAHLVGELRDDYEVGLPSSVADLDPDGADTLERMIGAVGAMSRWMDPFQYHAVLARLPVSIYIVAGASDLLSDALVEQGKRPNIVICNWRSEAQPGAPRESYDDVPTADNPLVLHIFGHLAHPDSITLTELDYIRFVRTVSPQTIPHHVHQAIVANSLMILGFRLHDWDFHMLFEGLINQPGSKSVDLPSVAVNVSLEDRWENGAKAREYLDNYFRRLSKRPVEIVWDRLDTVMRQLARLPSIKEQ